MNAHPRRSLLRLFGHVAFYAAFYALVPTVVSACLWDHDTLRQERSQFPAALELITGKFLRHSPEFYEWRIKDRQEKLKTDPTNLAYHDDLAVAYSKVGRTKDAIATMQAKEKLKPGLYETYSNLGTFYILAGDFEAGLPYIDKALEINPDAHFGREKYQKWLVEYAMLCEKKDGKLVLPLKPTRESKVSSFYDYVVQQQLKSDTTRKDDEIRREALTGVLGMMRFANHDNPLLLEAVANLTAGRFGNGQRIAVRAYLQASYVVKDDVAKQEYRKLADSAMGMQVGEYAPSSAEHPNIEDRFAAELVEARRWYDELRAKEVAWIRDGKDVEAEFDKLYTAEPVVRSETIYGGGVTGMFRRISWPRTLGLVAGLGVVAIGAIVWRRRRSSVV